MKTIISTAHEWEQKLPISDNRLICRRCGYERQMSEKKEKDCIPHREFKSSGWL